MGTRLQREPRFAAWASALAELSPTTRVAGAGDAPMASRARTDLPHNSGASDASDVSGGSGGGGGGVTATVHDAGVHTGRRGAQPCQNEWHDTLVAAEGLANANGGNSCAPGHLYDQKHPVQGRLRVASDTGTALRNEIAVISGRVAAVKVRSGRAASRSSVLARGRRQAPTASGAVGPEATLVRTLTGLLDGKPLDDAGSATDVHQFVMRARALSMGRDRACDRAATDRARSPTATDQARNPTVSDQARNPTATDRARNPTVADQAYNPTDTDTPDVLTRAHAVVTQLGQFSQNDVCNGQ